MSHDNPDERATEIRTDVVPIQPPGWERGLELRRYTLEQVQGPEVGKVHAAVGERCAIGAHPSNDLVIRNETVSRFHCEIHVTPSGARVRDLESANGTILDGVRVQEAWLRDGSELYLGTVVLRFHIGGGSLRISVADVDRYGELVGSSVAMRTAFSLLDRCAKSDATVLIQGETGTGKEGAAASIHAHSARVDKPFVVIDCGSIPENLIESELFGHERGAFTGAVSQRIGAFEQADGGTIFLDEIGELPTDLQPKLLRVLEQRTIRRVGSHQRRPVDVRVVAATNRDLRAEVNEGHFRSDLYYRLAVVKVTLPPLRERIADLPILVRALLGRLGATEDQIERFTSKSFLQRVRFGSWPGNVRELRNYLERCMVMDEPMPLHSGMIQLDDPEPTLGFRIDPNISYQEARRLAIEDFEKAYLDALVEQHEGNVSAAARAAGMDRVYLHRLLRKHGIKR